MYGTFGEGIPEEHHETIVELTFVQETSLPVIMIESRQLEASKPLWIELKLHKELKVSQLDLRVESLAHNDKIIMKSSLFPPNFSLDWPFMFSDKTKVHWGHCEKYSLENLAWRSSSIKNKIIILLASAAIMKTPSSVVRDLLRPLTSLGWAQWGWTYS